MESINTTTAESAGEDSLRKRYIYKMFSNVVGMFIGLATQAIIPRGLGPKAYGDFSFLTGFFIEVAAFLDMGTSIGFYTKLSHRPDDRGLIVFYFRFCALLALSIMLFTIMGAATPFRTMLWPGQEPKYIYLAAVWGLLTWFTQIASKMADAYGITVAVELAKIIHKGFAFALVAIMYFADALNLFSFFWYHYLILLVLLAVYVLVFERNGRSLRGEWTLQRDSLRSYLSEFYRYSHPLFIYAIVALLVGIGDRWLLQTFAGSVEQGFFGLSYQIGAICFLFTGAMTPLLTREFSIAFSGANLSGMAELFRRYIPLMYAIAAYFSCFIAINAEAVVYLFGGKGYAQATTAVIVMAFYPVHQTYGQLSGSVFYATGQTALYRNIGVMFMLLGIPITFFMIAPASMYGLSAGAAGLAVKTVALQFIAVNVQLFYNTSLLKLSFGRFFLHQVVSLACMLVLAWVASKGVMSLLEGRAVAGFFVSGIIYTILVAIAGYYVPALFGLKRDELNRFVEDFYSRLINSLQR